MKSTSTSGCTQVSRRRSNSQSHVVVPPLFQSQNSFHGSASAKTASKNKLQKRYQAEYYVTLTPLNDTFTTKHIHVPFFPDTCKLGRPTGTRVKPQVTNGYFDSRVLSRNHACMFVDPKTGTLMVQDMGSSNGTFVNLEKITADPVPINVGDTINLGFNIQVETSHKQISARIDNINVVSNNPKGAVLEGLPRLTLNIINNFTESELAQHDFVQSLFAKSREQVLPETSDQDKDTDERGRAFDQAMFADIVPSIDESFTNSSNPLNLAGIFNNSNIVSSPELVSTLDYLNVTVAKIKQQNNALKSIQGFFVKYAAQIDELNDSYLRMKMKEYDEKLSIELACDLEKSAKLAKEQDLKLSEQSSIISSYRKKVADLEQSNEFLLRKVEAYEKFNVNDVSDNEFSFTNESSLANSVEEVGQSVRSGTPSTNGPESVLPQSTPESEKHFNTLNNHEKSSYVVDEQALTKEPTSASLGSSPFYGKLRDALFHYKNHGAMLGFLIVVAGYYYQNNK